MNKTRLAVDLLGVLLIVSLLGILFLQLLGLPWLSGVMADDLPGEAYMRWPILALAIMGLGCVQVGILCTLRLLGFARRDEVFSPRALLWVDGIIGAFLSASLVCLATLVYQFYTENGPPLWILLLLFGVLAGIGMALLMVVMRTLLVQATALRTEIDAVI